jgi:hypothetical protein
MDRWFLLLCCLFVYFCLHACELSCPDDDINSREELHVWDALHQKNVFDFTIKWPVLHAHSKMVVSYIVGGGGGVSLFDVPACIF